MKFVLFLLIFILNVIEYCCDVLIIGSGVVGLSLVFKFVDYC